MIPSLLSLLLPMLGAGCGPRPLPLEGLRTAPFDTVFVPGCPTEADGTLSLCLERRVAWAAHLWEAGVTGSFVTSGAATYNRYVEAEALAAGLAALGVPPARVYLEPHARHTDENMYYSLRIVEGLGLDTVAVASDNGQAQGGCSFVLSWDRACRALPIENARVNARLADPGVAAALDAVRVPAVMAEDWLPVGEWEARRREETGERRPGSIALYAWHAPWATIRGRSWVPPLPPEEPVRTWEEVVAGRGAGG